MPRRSVRQAPEQQQALLQQQMQQQALSIAQQAIEHPETTDDEFRGVLAALVEANPDDARSRQVVLNEWGNRNPVAAAQEASRIEIAFAQHAQQMQQYQAQQQYEAEQQTLQQQQSQQQLEAEYAQGEFSHARDTFAQQHPDWQARDAGMAKFLAANPTLMQMAKQSPLVDPANPADRPRARAVHQVLKLAYDTAGAGIVGGVSEQGSNMGVVGNQNVINPASASSALAAEQRDLASLETGAAVDDVQISLNNPNPPGLADQSFEDLIGIPTVA